jgi:hypothetical protein
MKLTLRLIKLALCHEVVWGVEVLTHVFLTLAPVWTLFPSHLLPRERTISSHHTQGLVASELVWMLWRRENLLPLPGIKHGHATCSPSLYWLTYHGFNCIVIDFFLIYDEMNHCMMHCFVMSQGKSCGNKYLTIFLYFVYEYFHMLVTRHWVWTVNWIIQCL